MSTQTAAPAFTAHDLEPDLADRMRKALRVSDVGVQDMADYLGVGRNTVSTWINGRITPKVQSVRLWALRTGVPFEWLMNGESPRPVAEGSQDGLPRLDLNQRPSGYPSVQVTEPTACGVTPLRRASGTARARRVIRSHGAGEAA